MLRTSPIWTVNMMSVLDAPGQIDALKEMGVPVDWIELGNEEAIRFRGVHFCEAIWKDHVCTGPGCNPESECHVHKLAEAYLKRAVQVSRRARWKFPDAKIAIIGCHALNWDDCAPKLREAKHSLSKEFGMDVPLYDAVAIHLYGPRTGLVYQDPGKERVMGLRALQEDSRQWEKLETISGVTGDWLESDAK